MFGAPERLPAYGARTFSTVITTSMVQDLNEKITSVEFPPSFIFSKKKHFNSAYTIAFLTVDGGGGRGGVGSEKVNLWTLPSNE
jgi:hypothetical protein